MCISRICIRILCSRASRLKCHESSTLRQAYQRYGLAPSKLLPAKKKVKSPAPDRWIPFNHQKNTFCVGTFLFPPGHFAGSFANVDRSLFVFFCQRPIVAVSVSSSSASGILLDSWKAVHTIEDFQVKKPSSTVLKGPPQRFCWQYFLEQHLQTTDRWLRHGEPSTRLMPTLRKFDLTRGPLVSWMLAGWPWLASRCGWRWEMNGKCCFNIITLPIRFHPLIHRCTYVCAVSYHRIYPMFPTLKQKKLKLQNVTSTFSISSSGQTSPRYATLSTFVGHKHWHPRRPRRIARAKFEKCCRLLRKVDPQKFRSPKSRDPHAWARRNHLTKGTVWGWFEGVSALCSLEEQSFC